MTGKIKRIHEFGAPVGKWTIEPTVAETIARERKRLKELAVTVPNVMPIKRAAK